MLSDAFSFPRNGDGATKTLLIGGAIELARILILPGILALGYYLQAFEAGAKGTSKPHKFEDWGTIVSDGLNAFGVLFIYSFLATLVAFAGIFLSVFIFPMGTGVSSTAGILQMVFVLGAFSFAGLIMYPVPASLTALATQGSFSAAFKLSGIWRVINTKEYFVGTIVALVVYVVVGTVMNLLMIVLIGFVGRFYLNTSLAYYLGATVRKSV